MKMQRSRVTSDTLAGVPMAFGAYIIGFRCDGHFVFTVASLEPLIEMFLFRNKEKDCCATLGNYG